jgi:MSHA biogenesis protein MshN
MSLVNEMLRDLEARRAAPADWQRLEGLHAVDEEAIRRRERVLRLRRGFIWLGAVILLGLLVGMMIGRVVRDEPQPPTAVPAVPVVAPAPIELLEVLPQEEPQRFVLQLLLERTVVYRRVEQNGAVSLHLPGVGMPGEARQGRVQRDGRSLSWRIEAQGDGVQVLLVGLGERLEVRDRIEPAGERALLWVEVPFAAESAQGEPALDLAALPEAEAEAAQLPDWMTRPAQPAEAELPTPGVPVAPPAPSAEPSGPAEVKIASHRPDALTLARQALLAEDYPRAIAELETLHKQRPDDAETTRWLARAYLAGGRQERLLTWLPEQLPRHPRDSELALLLARAQLQSGDSAAAVASLTRHPPPLEREPGYHALLAASYQQTGQWQESAAVYAGLTKLRPSQATWQLGLAIALEQLDQPAAAGRHYRLALQGQGLDDSSRRFAAERAATLRGQP